MRFWFWFRGMTHSITTINLSGFEYCDDHPDPLILRRAEFHRMLATEFYPLTRAMEIFSPNGTVRKRVRDERLRYVRLLGQPTVGQRVLEQTVLSKARTAAQLELSLPANVSPKVEPYKRYDYHRNAAHDECPYSVTHPRRELSYRLYDASRRASVNALNRVAQAVGKVQRVLHPVAPTAHESAPKGPARPRSTVAAARARAALRVLG